MARPQRSLTPEKSGSHRRCPLYPDHALLSTESTTSEHPLVPLAPPAAPPRPRRRWSPLSVLGIVVSISRWPASSGGRPSSRRRSCPRTPKEIAALIGAIALYALATVVRSERWQRLLDDEGATPHRADTYSLTVVGYMGNNVLPARAGDAIRVVLMAPRANTSNRTVVGTLVAERLLDIAVLLVLFVVVGYGLLGEVGGNSVELIALVAIVGISAAGVGWRFIRKQREAARHARADRVGDDRPAQGAPRAPVARR